MRGAFSPKGETKDKLEKCENCLHSFKDSYNLKRHIERRSCYPRYKCEKCRKKFSSDADLSMHIGESKCFQCNQCNFVSASYGALIQHKQRHKERKNTIVLNVKNPFTHQVTWRFTWESTQKKNHSLARNATKDFPPQTTWELMKQGTLAGKILCVQNVINPFLPWVILKCTLEFTMVKSPTNVMNVTKLSVPVEI